MPLTFYKALSQRNSQQSTKVSRAGIFITFRGPQRFTELARVAQLLPQSQWRFPAQPSPVLPGPLGNGSLPSQRIFQERILASTSCLSSVEALPFHSHLNPFYRSPSSSPESLLVKCANTSFLQAPPHVTDNGPEGRSGLTPSPRPSPSRLILCTSAWREWAGLPPAQQPPRAPLCFSLVGTSHPSSLFTTRASLLHPLPSHPAPRTTFWPT